MTTSIEIANQLQKVKFTKAQAEKVAVLIEEEAGHGVTREVLSSKLEKLELRLAIKMTGIVTVALGIFKYLFGGFWFKKTTVI